ncbi:hypothetical protein SUGI_0865140 [Cryptomeria japonica]|nr:hypothetical protein SUGI_0865140 [Cryptomeria japonica]
MQNSMFFLTQRQQSKGLVDSHFQDLILVVLVEMQRLGYLQGGSIVPVGPCIQHTGEAKLTDTLILLVALDEQGKAEGIIFEDNGDGYEYQQGQFLLTYYEAELSSSTVSVIVSRTEGLWKRPKRKLHVQLLLGEGAKIEAWGQDGEKIKFEVLPTVEVENLVAESQKQHSIKIAQAIRPPDEKEHHAEKGTELSRTPVDLESGEWRLKVIPWIGGRMISMTHIPSDTQWLHSRLEKNGYEEYSGVEYHSAVCSEAYTVIKRDLQQAEEEESLTLEGDIGGGLVLQREICVPKSRPKVVRIESTIIARNQGIERRGFKHIFLCLSISSTFFEISRLNLKRHEMIQKKRIFLLESVKDSEPVSRVKGQRKRAQQQGDQASNAPENTQKHKKISMAAP